MLLDIFLLVVVALAFFSSYKRGLLYIVAFLLGISFGVFISLSFSSTLTNLLEQVLRINPVWIPFLSLVISFAIVFLVVKYLSAFLKTILETLNLNQINKALGGAVGAVIAFGLISIGYLHLTESQLITAEIAENSRFYGVCLDMAPNFMRVFGAIVPWIDRLFDSLAGIFTAAANAASPNAN